MDDRIFNDWMKDNNILVGKGFVYFFDEIWDRFKIDGGMWDEKWKIIGYRFYIENCDFN